MRAWCVVNTLPCQEVRAEVNLLRQGFRAWLPITQRVRRHARRVDMVHAPLFPGYLFVELDLDYDAWSPINSTYGVRSILVRGARPETVHGRFIEGLRKTISEGGACALPLECESLRAGVHVRIAHGPFADCIATILGFEPKERVALLLGLLGGKVKTTISRWAVVPEV